MSIFKQRKPDLNSVPSSRMVTKPKLKTQSAQLFSIAEKGQEYSKLKIEILYADKYTTTMWPAVWYINFEFNA